LLGLLEKFRLPLVLDEAIATPTIMGKLARDKKFSAGKIRFVLLDAPGHAYVSDGVTQEDLRDAIEHLRQLPE